MDIFLLMLLLCALIWMRFFVNFGHEKVLPLNFLEFVGIVIGMPM